MITSRILNSFALTLSRVNLRLHQRQRRQRTAEARFEAYTATSSSFISQLVDRTSEQLEELGEQVNLLTACCTRLTQRCIA